MMNEPTEGITDMTTTEEQDRLDNEKHADGIVEDRKQAPPPYFTILFYGLILWGVVFCAYYLLSGWSSEGEFTRNMEDHQKTYAAQPAEAPQAPAEETAPVNGSALYAELCAVCHAADGTGGIGPDLTGEYAYGKTPEAITASIAEGRPGGMPGFASQLSAAEIGALVNHLTSL